MPEFSGEDITAQGVPAEILPIYVLFLVNLHWQIILD